MCVEACCKSTSTTTNNTIVHTRKSY